MTSSLSCCVPLEVARSFALRIVLVMIEPPLPFGNAAARWYHVLLRGLVRRGHDVTALATCGDERDIPRALELFPDTDYDLRCFPVDRSAGVAKKAASLLRPMSYLFSPDFRRAFADTTARGGYDVLHLEQQWCGWLSPRFDARTVVSLQYLFAIDRPGAVAASLHQKLVAFSATRAERKLVRRFANIAALTPRLAAAAAEMNPRARTFVTPLGIDTLLYPFDPRPTDDGPPTVGLIGSFNWTPTAAAGRRLVDRLWPRIKARLPEARLLIVGRGADRAFGHAEGADVAVHADVPDAIPYFRRLDVMLYAPDAGSGIKVKVLEAFALGTPVVTNSDGVEGIDAIDGVHFEIADTDDALVERAVALLSDPARCARLRTAARELVEAQHGPEATLDQVERMYRVMFSANALTQPSHHAVVLGSSAGASPQRGEPEIR